MPRGSKIRAEVKATQGLTADCLHDLRQQGITRVAIEVFVARLEIQILLAGDHGEDIVVGDQVLGVAPACEGQQFPMIADAAGMVEQMSKGDRLAEIRQLGHICPYGIIKRQFSFG